MSTSDNRELTLKDLFLLLWEGRWLIAVAIVLGGIVGVLYAFSTVPIYKVDALVQIQTKQGRGGGISPLGEFSDFFQVNNPAETEIELIKSRMVLGRVVSERKMDLWAQPMDYGRWDRLLRKPKPSLQLERLSVPPRLLGASFVLTLGPDQSWTITSEKFAGEAHGKLGQPLDSASNPIGIHAFIRSAENAPEGTRFRIARIPPQKAIGSLRSRLSASEVGKKTGIVTLSITDPDPVEAAEILNDIANMYLRQNVEQKSAEAEKTLEFIQAQLPEIKRSLELSEERLNQYRSAQGSVDLTEEAKLALGQQVDIQQKLVDLEKKRKEALQHYTDDHPNVRLLDSLRTILLAKSKTQDDQVKALPRQQQEVVRLMRDVQVNTELYTELLNSSQQLKVVKGGETGNVRVVDPALPSLRPIKPKKNTVILLSLFLGFFIGAGVVLVRRMFQSGVEDPRVVEQELGLPVYATILHSRVQEKLYRQVRQKTKECLVLAVKSPSDLAVESFRSLRTTLHFSMLDAPNKILLFAGPSPGIGKSFVATNFAAILAQANHKVILVDADLRCGLLHQHFGQDRGKGLSDILSGTDSFESVLRDSGIPNLQILTTGTVPPNASELLLHERFGQLLERLDADFDYVVIDSAPVLAVTDAVIVGKMSGTCMMVLKHGKHPLDEIRSCAQRMNQAGVNLKGVVFNDMQASGGAYGYRYGTAAYQYTYGNKKA